MGLSTNDEWFKKWWTDLCSGAPDAKELREWAYRFYGLSGVEQDLDYLRAAKKEIEERGWFDSDRFYSARRAAPATEK